MVSELDRGMKGGSSHGDKKKQEEMNAGQKYLKTEQEAATGEWGAKDILATNIQAGVSKLGHQEMGGPR